MGPPVRCVRQTRLQALSLLGIITVSEGNQSPGGDSSTGVQKLGVPNGPSFGRRDIDRPVIRPEKSLSIRADLSAASGGF